MVIVVQATALGNGVQVQERIVSSCFTSLEFDHDGTYSAIKLASYVVVESLTLSC